MQADVGSNKWGGEELAGTAVNTPRAQSIVLHDEAGHDEVVGEQAVQLGPTRPLQQRISEQGSWAALQPE